MTQQLDIVTDMRRCYEQFLGQRTLETFDSFDTLQTNFENIAEEAVRCAMDGRQREILISRAAVRPMDEGAEYGKGVLVHFNVDAKYSVGLFQADPYGVNGRLANAMFNNFTKFLRAQIKTLYGTNAYIYVRHNGYGRNKNFTFYVTVKCYPSIPMSQEAA